MKYENGVRVSDPAAQYNMTKLHDFNFLKNKKTIKAAEFAKGVSILHSKQRPQIMDEVEKPLQILITEELDGDSINEGIICEKAQHIYADLLKETSAEGESGFTSKASRGWLERLKHQSEVNRVVRHGEAASSNKEADKKYVGEFRDFIYAGGYLPSKCLTITRLAYF